MVECVAIPTIASHLDQQGAFRSTEVIDAAATGLLDELRRWAVALKPMRA